MLVFVEHVLREDKTFIAEFEFKFLLSIIVLHQKQVLLERFLRQFKSP